MTETVMLPGLPQPDQARMAPRGGYFDYRDYDDALQAQAYARDVYKRLLAMGAVDYGWMLPGTLQTRVDDQGVWFTVTMP